MPKLNAFAVVAMTAVLIGASAEPGLAQTAADSVQAEEAYRLLREEAVGVADRVSTVPYLLSSFAGAATAGFFTPIVVHGGEEAIGWPIAGISVTALSYAVAMVADTQVPRIVNVAIEGLRPEMRALYEDEYARRLTQRRRNAVVGGTVFGIATGFAVIYGLQFLLPGE